MIRHAVSGSRFRRCRGRGNRDNRSAVAMYVPLSGSSRFEAVLRHGIRLRRGGITVIGMRRAEGSTRVGLVVGRRVGRAVVRNRVKRRLRAALNEVGLPSGADYVVIGSAAVADVPFRTLCGWLQEAGLATGAGKECGEPS